MGRILEAYVPGTEGTERMAMRADGSLAAIQDFNPNFSSSSSQRQFDFNPKCPEFAGSASFSGYSCH